MIKLFIVIILFNLQIYANYFNPKSYNLNNHGKQNNIEYNSNKTTNKQILENKILKLFKNLKLLENSLNKYYEKFETYPTSFRFLFMPPNYETHSSELDIYGIIGKYSRLQVKNNIVHKWEKFQEENFWVNEYISFPCKNNKVLNLDLYFNNRCIENNFNGDICIGAQINGKTYLNYLVVTNINKNIMSKIVNKYNKLYSNNINDNTKIYSPDSKNYGNCFVYKFVKEIPNLKTPNI